MRRFDARAIAALLSALSIAGCSVLSPRPDPTRFFVLTGLPASAAPSAAVAGGSITLGLGPVQLPAYLDHPEVVTRSAPNQIDLSPTDRWAEPLDNNFRQVLGRNLSVLLGNSQVVPFPWDVTTKLDYKVSISVERFERDSSGGSQLAARWTLGEGASDRVLMTREASFSEAAASPADTAQALSAELGDLSRQIAEAIIQLRQQRPAMANG